MSQILDNIYENMREKEVHVAKVRLKKINVDSIHQNISKSCWHYGIKDEVIIKNNEMLLIKLTGEKRTMILKYHKTDVVLWDELEKLMKVMEFQGVERAVYITTGIFDAGIKEYSSQSNLASSLQLVDCVKFVRKQLGLMGSVSKCITKDKICFMEYMPE